MTSHNLDIQRYSLDELFTLFDITNPLSISIEDVKRAKKKVLMTHPDKSGLAADYFLFYKKAFDIVLNFWENQNKQNKVITKENTKYNPNKSDDKTIKNAIKEISPEDFQKRFNQLFEENMYEKPNVQKNEWFSKEEPTYVVDETVNNKNMGVVLEKIKEKQNGLIKYRGVENITSSGVNSANSYHDDDDGDNYVTSDIFGKLKFDDLRKVHKDQTIFAVSERDIEKVPKYSSVDHFIKERGANLEKPMEKEEAERMLSQENLVYREQIMRKEYAANLRMKENEIKNKNVLSNFLRLQN